MNQLLAQMKDVNKRLAESQQMQKQLQQMQEESQQKQEESQKKQEESQQTLLTALTRQLEEKLQKIILRQTSSGTVLSL